ncbi:MAG: histidinol dehydrogenase, partial [Silvibacterium sp.]
MKLISTAGRGARAGRVSIAALLARRNAAYERALPAARRIVDGVRKGGDAALRRYAEKFDGNTQPQQLQISQSEMAEAWKLAPPAFKKALKLAAKNIRSFAERQK